MIEAVENTALTEISKGRQMLAQANDIQTMLTLRDMAAAAQLFANAQGFKDAAQEAKIFQLQAERKAGTWLAENVNHNGNQFSTEYQLGTPLPEGVTRNESSRWQLEASLPEEVFNEWVDERLANGWEISAAGLQKVAKEIVRKESINQQREDIENGAVGLPTGQFEVISIDPPWPYGTEYDPNGRRAANPYPEMSLEEIKAIEIPATDDCILWLWTTHKFMRYSFEILDHWGFRDVAIITWEKDRMGLGQWLRSQTEFCIMAVKGKPIVDLTNQTTILHGKMREHSRKPDEFYAMVDSLCVGRKLDYFSREQRDGWSQFGNDVERFS